MEGMKKARDVDIFQRTLCCNPIRKEDEIEIFEPESAEVEAEEEEIPLVEEEKIDIKLIMQELECMKRRIQVMQLRLKHYTDECPEEECVDYEVLLHCSENKEICVLQKNHHKLQCQIKELVKCCKTAKAHIEDLHLNMCERIKEIMHLQKAVHILTDWKNTLEHEFGKCIERFEYLKHCKAEWHDVNEKLHQQQKFFDVMKEKFVPKWCFQEEKKSFIGSINEIKEMMKELFQYQFQRFECLEKRLPGPE